MFLFIALTSFVKMYFLESSGYHEMDEDGRGGDKDELREQVIIELYYLDKCLIKDPFWTMILDAPS